MENQKALTKIQELKSSYHDDITFNQIINLIDQLSDINEKLRGYNETLIFTLSDLNTTDSNSVTKKLKLMEYVLKKGANPNTLNQTAQIPALFIIKEEDGFDLLIEYGADVNFRSEYVHIFNKVTTYERVKKVIELGLDTTKNTSYGNLYIHIFLNEMDTQTLDFLLIKYPEKAIEYDNLGWNVTHYIASGNRTDLLEILIKHKINLTLPTKSENEGNYGYDNGIKEGSDVLSIIEQLKTNYVSKVGPRETEDLIEKVKDANTVYSK